MSQTVRYACLLEALEPSGVLATIPAIPGCSVEGKTREEALEKARQMAESLLEEMARDDEDLPDPELEAVMLEVALPDLEGDAS